jgi:uncharacterized protein YjiS (DUF1127 family)
MRFAPPARSAGADDLACLPENRGRTAMSETASIISAPATTKRLGASLRLLNACCDGVVGYFVRRAAAKTLRELDDRALKDIGLVRAQIECAVQGLISSADRGRM